MGHDVFISYESSDKKIADAMCAALEAARIRCWIAPRDVLAGEVWSESLVLAIDRSRLLLLVYSETANGSPQVLREVERAVAKSLVILPFRVADAPFSKSFEYFLNACHWLDALSPPVEKHIAHLVKTVGLLLSRFDAGAVPVRDGHVSTEQQIRAADPKAVAFKEVEFLLSDTWDAFRAWLATELGDVAINSIAEDTDSADPDFYCSGRPGSLAYRLTVSANRRGIPVQHKLDLVHEWLHPLALSMEPTRTYVPWDTSLFPPGDVADKEKKAIDDPIARCRDARYWVLFAKLR